MKTSVFCLDLIYWILNDEERNMATAKRLNKIADTVGSGYIPFDSLEIDKLYKVNSFNIFKSTAFNKERDCVRVNIDDGYLILPERFDCLADDLGKLKVEKLYIVYEGREEKGNRLKISFQERNEPKNKTD